MRVQIAFPPPGLLLSHWRLAGLSGECGEE
jgi:hypothetical protein